MKCLKQAAKSIVTAGLTLCLLLPCSVPASAALQTPAWMQAWANTRTAGGIAQLEKDQFTAKIKVDGVEGILDMVRSSGNMNAPKYDTMSKNRSHHSEHAMNRNEPMQLPEKEPMPPMKTMSKISYVMADLNVLACTVV